MAKKSVLVVAGEKDTRDAMRGIILNLMRDKSVECFATPHIGAFGVFMVQQPSVVIVCDYTMKGSLAKGFRTYVEIKDNAKEWQKVIRIGSESHHHPDYIMHPSGEVPIAKAEESLRASLRSLFAA